MMRCMAKRPTARTRVRSTDELLGDLRRATLQIDEGISRFDGGDPAGLDLIAARVRLVACRGRGNELLQRVCDRVNEPMPLVGHSSPAVHTPSTAFAVGGLPASGEGALRSPLAKLMSQVCLIVDDDGELNSFTWDELVFVAANKLLLVHSDDDIPTALDEIDTFSIGAHRGIAYMIRQAGVLTVRATTVALAAAGTPAQVRDHPDGVSGDGAMYALIVREGRDLFSS
ncbi:MAG: hypothetical protein B7C54_00195 [Acidimicrobiales bacterium mtb01]|nr:MAG: hypothetical protein B7C54_00195 [Acidimicrobiales bacterium mtb01]